MEVLSSTDDVTASVECSLSVQIIVPFVTKGGRVIIIKEVLELAFAKQMGPDRVVEIQDTARGPNNR